MIENDSKYPTHLTPSRFRPLVIVRASVTASIKMTPTSRVKMAFDLAWDQARQCGKKKKGGQIEKISAVEASRAVAWGGGAALSPPQTTSRLTSPAFFFFFSAHADFFFSFFLPVLSLVRSY